jgi:hypothetical protein
VRAGGGVDYVKMICIALVVGFIGPLFWLGVNVLETKGKASFARFRQRRRARHAEKAARADDSLLQ